MNPQQRVASRYLMRIGFNKFNAPELMGQLLRVLQDQGLDEAVEAIRSCKVPQKVDTAWKNRGKTASAQVGRVLKQVAEHFKRKHGLHHEFDDQGVGPAVSMWDEDSEPTSAPMFSAFYDPALDEWGVEVRIDRRVRSLELEPDADAQDLIRALEHLGARSLKNARRH